MIKPLCLALLILASFATSAGAVTYQGIDLGVLPGFGSTYAIAINDRGEVVGYADPILYSGGRTHAWYWSTSTGMVDLGAGVAKAINNNGRIAGSLDARACVWTSLTTTIDLGTYGRAEGINDSGEIAGQCSSNNHAVYWDASGNMTDFSSLISGTTECRAWGINESGDVVGQTHVSARIYYAYKWNSYSNTATMLADIWSLAGGINDRGQVVGIMANVSGGTDLVVWNPDGSRRLLRPNNAFWNPSAINNAGQVPYKSVVYNADGTTVQLTGSSAEGYGINEEGWVVGSSRISSATHAMLWRPVPEPSTVLALLCGLAGTIGLVRRKKA